jgi:cardiolipin synthase
MGCALPSAGKKPRRVGRFAGLAFLAVAGLLVSCRSLPQVGAGGAQRQQGVPVQLEGRRGALTPAQSKAVLARLAQQQGGGRADAILDRHLAIEEAIVGSPLTTGNDVRLLQDGPATYAAMFAAIAAARDHINMETYIIEDDEVGQRFAQALIDKQRQGVQVNLIHDSVGTLATPKAFFERLSESGVRVLEFNPLNPLVARKDWEVNQRDHRKLLIVDGRVAFLGGINISNVYSGGSSKPRKARAAGDDTEKAWRDTDLQVRGPVVAEFQKLFISAWESQKAEPLAARNYFPAPEAAGRQVVRAIGSSPEEPYSQIYATLMSAIGSAETSIYVTNAYFAPDPQLLEALEAAVLRGVAVKMILPSRTDSWLVFHAGRAHYTRLLRSGIKLYERRGAILHSKTALIDGVWATIGSTNLDWRSFLHNHELNAVVLGAEFGAEVQAMFDKDLAASDEITLERWRQRSLALRLKEAFAQVWAYWL